MTILQFPEYVSRSFAVTHQHAGHCERRLQRTYRLIGEALEGVVRPEWRVDALNGPRSPIADEPYGFEHFSAGFCVYAEERGKRSMLALFSQASLAADYFVWMVSGGERKIDWSRHLDMEP